MDTTEKSNLTRYKQDLDSLIELGNGLYNSMLAECYPERHTKLFSRVSEDNIKSLPNFYDEYQGWYSESLSVIKLLLPDRLTDFISYYEIPKNRTNVTDSSYVIEDYLRRVYKHKGVIIIAHPKSAIPRFKQQLSILKSCLKVFESSLFEIKQWLQTDLFDSELEMAKELNKNNLYRASGAIAGVVLERHLAQVCKNRNLQLSKKDLTINNYNDLLYNEKIIHINIFKHIQLLGSIRNNCVHHKSNEPEPIKDDIDRLISGTNAIIKTVY